MFGLSLVTLSFIQDIINFELKTVYFSKTVTVEFLADYLLQNLGTLRMGGSFTFNNN